MSEEYEMYLNENERITKEKNRRLSETSTEFMNLVRDIVGPRSVTETGVEKQYKLALKQGAPSTFFKRYESDLRKAMKPELIPLFYYEIDRVREYQYDDSSYRRSYRSSDYTTYIKLIREILTEFITYSALGVSITDYLGEKTPEIAAYKNQYYAARFAFVIAAVIDSGDLDICDTIEDIVLNGTGRVSIELIRGVFLSKDEKLYDLMGKLLLAARLQEGLRQAICENMDFGTREAFNTIFRVISDNDLLRFSSVQRAIEVFTGLAGRDEKAGDRINKKQCDLMQSFLSDPAACENAFLSDDHMVVYLGLWTLATTSIETACERAFRLIYEGSREQKLTAAYFLRNFGTDSEDFIEVFEQKSDELDLIAILMQNFMTGISTACNQVLSKPGHGYREYVTSRVFADPTFYFQDEAGARKAYFAYQKILKQLPNKKLEWNGIVFPWYNVTLTKTDCVTRMVYCASAAKDKALTLEVARDLASVENYCRGAALPLLLNEPENREEYEIVTKALSDAEEYTRKSANNMLTHELSRDTSGLAPEIRSEAGRLPAICYPILEDMLRLKRADMRKNAISLLMTMDDADKIEMFGRLLSDKSEEKRAAALDMILTMKKEDSPCFKEALAKTEILAAPTTREQVLLDEIKASGEDASGTEGSGLFDPDASYEPVFDMERIAEFNAAWDRVFPNKKVGGKSPKNGATFDDAGLLKELNDLIEKNKDLEYEAWNGTRLLGNGIATSYVDGKPVTPFPELWDGFYDEFVKSDDALLRLAFILCRSSDMNRLSDVRGYTEFCNRYVMDFFGIDFSVLGIEKLKYSGSFRQVTSYLSQKHDLSDLKSMIGSAIAYYIAKSDDRMEFTFTKADLGEKVRTNLEKETLVRTPLMDSAFSLFINGMEYDWTTFPIKVALMRKFDGDFMKDSSLMQYAYSSYNKTNRNGLMDVPSVQEYLRACADGVISKDVLYKRFFDGFEKEAFEMLSSAIIFIRDNNDAKSTRVRSYSARRNYLMLCLLGRRNTREIIDPASITEQEKKVLNLAEECYDAMIGYCVGKELRRGDTPTEYSAYMKEVNRLYGLGFFTGILKSLGKGTLNRSKYYYGNADSKEAVLSHLLAVCVPDGREGDAKEQAAKLKELLKGTDIREQRLIEAALFTPEWLDVIGEYLGFDGFRSGCYYFMAHMNEEFDDKRKAAIAKYSPISPEEFNAGAFDKTWFDEVYALLGEKKFNEIYDAAKYISDGAKHARARKYADAATGKLDPEKTRDEIAKKRNKDLLMAYAIMPGKDAEIRERYCYIRQFIKESKQYGAQRRASEKLAGETAIKNMATAQGYPDETRFILKMENEIASELASFWELQKIGDVEAGLFVEAGKVGIRILKGGKELKSIPAALKKDELYLDLQEAKQTFTEQYRRTKLMFEEAMESRTSFTREELEALRKNPVLTDMINALIFESDGQFGLLSELAVGKGSDVYVAHSYTMYKAGVWKDMQAMIFEREIVQPFKQVFRELYVKTEEESNCYDSRRYAGNQIQTKQTIGALKGRRWIADVEDGLQKVYYKENIIATIYALADWFSPSDIEAPTLEWVAFYDRKSGKAMQIKDVPDIIFSEVMRDVDLAVSVAHAGEVDPEMSHSTVEMRRAVAEFTCKSFKLQNVTFTDTHALIKGTRANYTVHLGSGIIHLEGGLMINVLPVHSQKRGRIFLPFVDDDPKTAEVISKILLFAEDSKIKDPFILNQIV